MKMFFAMINAKGDSMRIAHIARYICLLCLSLWYIIGDELKVPPHTMQHHEEILETPSKPSLSLQMINLMTEPMMEVPFLEDDNLDLNYLSNMIPNHQGTIAACEFFLHHSKHQKLRKIAQNTIDTQKAEIATFLPLIDVLKASKKLYSPKEVTLFNTQAKTNMESMFKIIGDITFSTLNRDFILGMIPNHQATIDVSKQILQYTQDERIRTIAQNIIISREAEIEALTAILKTMH